jgi:hypothetical protein
MFQINKEVKNALEKEQQDRLAEENCRGYSPFYHAKLPTTDFDGNKIED